MNSISDVEEPFFTTKLKATDNLAPGELVTEIVVPIPQCTAMSYDKFRLREAVDFAIVSVASMYKTNGTKIQSAKLVFGGVAPVPYQASAVENFLEGKDITAETAEAAADIAVRDSLCLEKNAYKAQELKTLIKRSILAL